MKHHNAIRFEGHVSAGFETVRDAFVDNFSRRRELGGACCVYQQYGVRQCGGRLANCVQLFLEDDSQKTVAKRDAKKAFLIGRNHVVRGMKYMQKMAVEKDRQSV